jgi:allatostatin receptor
MLRRLWFGVGPAGHTSSESVRGKKRVTRLVIIVVAFFAVCWCPIQIILVLKSLDAYAIDKVTISFQIASHVLAYMNSCVNPILYAFLSDNFRKAFLKLIYCGASSYNARYGAASGGHQRRGTEGFAANNLGNQNGRARGNTIEMDRTNTMRLRKGSSPGKRCNLFSSYPN